MKRYQVKDTDMNAKAFYAYSNSSYTVYEDGDGFAIAANETEKPFIREDDMSEVEEFFMQVYREDCTWYAVMMDKEDTDHGYGSNDLDEAMRMCRDMREDHPDAYIAVISPEDDFCLDEIYLPDVDYSLVQRYKDSYEAGMSVEEYVEFFHDCIKSCDNLETTDPLTYLTDSQIVELAEAIIKEYGDEEVE